MKKNEEYPLVTVIILTYRKFDFLEETINSVFSQDYPNIEIIISDDGSDNFDIGYINSLILNRKSNIKNIDIVQHKKNLGTVKNINNCIKISQGDYFIGLSSDDCYYSNSTISEIVKYYRNTGALIVTTKRAIFDINMIRQVDILPSNSDLKYLEGDQSNLFRRLCYSNFISGAATSYSRELFEKYGTFDERYSLLEDYPYYLKLSRLNEKIFYFDYISIKYRLGGISTNTKQNPKLIIDSQNLIIYEILPYKNDLGNLLCKIKDFEYNFSHMGFKRKAKAILSHPNVFFLKLMNKVNLIPSKPEGIIYKD